MWRETREDVYGFQKRPAFFYDPVNNSTLNTNVGALTFTRASVGREFDSGGILQAYAIDTPRFGYNQTTLAAKGLLIENAATQLVTPLASVRDMTNAAWVKVTMTTAKTAIGADGVANSATTLTAAGVNSTILQTLVAAATERIYSVLIKRRTGTGAVLLVNGVSTLDITSLINASTYTLVQLVDTTLNAAFGLQINTPGDAIDVDFNQFEASPFASSRIDDSLTARAADFTNISLGSWFSASQGTIYVEFLQPLASTPRRYVVSINDGTTANRIIIYQQIGVNHFEVFSGAVKTADLSIAAPAAGSVTRVSFSYALNEAIAYQNGIAATINTPMTTLAVSPTTMELGTQLLSATGNLTSYLRTVNYYSSALGAATQQRITQ